MESGNAVPGDAAKWLGDALRAYLTSECLDITASLGLRPRRGGRFETPAALFRMRERDSLICTIADAVPATTAKGKSEACQKLITGTAQLQDTKIALVIDKLRREFAGDLPASARQLGRIIKKEGVHHRR